MYEAIQDLLNKHEQLLVSANNAINKNDYLSLLEILKKIALAHPNNPAYHELLADTYVKLERYIDAVVSYEKADKIFKTAKKYDRAIKFCQLAGERGLADEKTIVVMTQCKDALYQKRIYKKFHISK